MNRAIEMTVNGVAQLIGFDSLGRVTSVSNPLDSFTYGYSDGTSRITAVSSNAGPTAAVTYFAPAGDELLEQMNITTHSGSTSLAQFGYTYNADDNVKTLAVSSPSAQTSTYAYDTANRLLSSTVSGSTQNAYGYDHASNLLTITSSGTTQSFSYTSTNAITAATYDANGSPTVVSSKSYKWDGANRIVHFTNSAANTASSFAYDGLGRLVRVVDTHGGAITADHSYTWCGNVRCLAHDNTQSGSPVSTQYFDQGAIIGGTSYYYVKDQLGSVAEVVTSTGTIASQYSYDPYGNQTTVSGTASDIGYAGYFYHAVSGLDFTLYRAYDPTHARWLNRDPIAEAGGVNLYAYTAGNPVRYSDPSGTCGPFTPLCVAIYVFLVDNAATIGTVAAIGAEVAADVPNPVSSPIAATVAEERAAVEAFNNFRAAKAALGPRVGQTLHHVVEQCQAGVARSAFSKLRLNSTDNLMYLDNDIHDVVSAFYSSKPPGALETVRNSLNGLSFEEQLDFGKSVVQRAIAGQLP